ncbi:MAG: hypothetical protein R3F48_14705 [Candidatus Zixiibacteriota bacterium]
MIRYFPWPWGKPAPIWLRYQDFIGSLIKEHKLKPIDRAYHFDINTRVPVQYDMEMPAMKTIKAQQIAVLPFPWPRPCPGGMPGPHLHWGDDIYMADAKVWDVMTKQVVKDFTTVMRNSKTIGFEHLMNIGEMNEMMM